MPLKVQKDIESSINLTPLIDIVFLLIIFFMVGTKFTELNELERNIPLNLPSVSNASALTAAPQKRVVNILDDGTIFLDKQQVSIDELKTELVNAREQYQNLGVVIRGDENARHKTVVAVLETCKEAQIKDFFISARYANATASPQNF